jgi:cell shape-determining protein MreD
MNAVLSILWWAAYIMAALIVQQQIPGVDALAPGLLLSLQEKRVKQSVWLFLIFVLVQEGSGSLGFGSALIWYGGLVALFRLAERRFLADNALFICMLSSSLGVFHGLVIWFMCMVQKVPVEYIWLIRESVIQAALIPVIWGAACLFRPKTLCRG